jgi:hypothetical protein
LETPGLNYGVFLESLKVRPTELVKKFVSFMAYHRVQKNPQLDFILSHFNPFHILYVTNSMKQNLREKANVRSWPRNSPPFVESEFSLPCFYQPAPGP